MNQTEALIVCADEPTLQRVTDRLQRRNVSCLATRCAADALDEMRNRFCRIAIMDVVFDGQYDLELISQLRQINPLVQIYMLTEAPTAELIIDCAERGVIDFFSKTSDIPRMVDRVVCSLHTATRWLSRIKFGGSPENANADPIQQAKDELSILDSVDIPDEMSDCVGCSLGVTQSSERKTD